MSMARLSRSLCALTRVQIQMGTNHKFFFSSLCRLRAELCFLLKPSTVSSVQPYPLPGQLYVQLRVCG